MKISIYSTLFNVASGHYNINEVFNNWFKYADEVIIATFSEEKEEVIKYIKSELGNKIFNYKVVDDFKIKREDPLFDGKLKNKALRSCSHEQVIQQDMDERIGGKKEYWLENFKKLTEVGFTCTYFIPVIDLYKDLAHYKSINGKWYQHLKSGVYRGPVNFAIRKDNTLDISKSDSTEAISINGDLLPSYLDNRFKEYLDPQYPHVIHLGYLDLNKRVENNKFWEPIWSARNGEKVKVATDLETIELENEAKPHNLKERWWDDD